MKIKQAFHNILILLATIIFGPKRSNAQLSELGIRSGIGEINDIPTLYVLIINTIMFFGWVGVVIGVIMAGFATITKIISSDSEDAQKQFSNYMLRSVVIVLLGILLANALFFVETFNQLFGSNNYIDPANPSIFEIE